MVHSKMILSNRTRRHGLRPASALSMPARYKDGGLQINERNGMKPSEQRQTKHGRGHTGLLSGCVRRDGEIDDPSRFLNKPPPGCHSNTKGAQPICSKQ